MEKALAKRVHVKRALIYKVVVGGENVKISHLPRNFFLGHGHDFVLDVVGVSEHDGLVLVPHPENQGLNPHGAQSGALCSEMRVTDHEIVFPYVHPGPFGEIGTSNLPFKIYSRTSDISQETMVFHTSTTNSNNCASDADVDNLASVT